MKQNLIKVGLTSEFGRALSSFVCLVTMLLLLTMLIQTETKSISINSPLYLLFLATVIITGIGNILPSKKDKQYDLIEIPKLQCRIYADWFTDENDYSILEVTCELNDFEKIMTLNFGTLVENEDDKDSIEIPVNTFQIMLDPRYDEDEIVAYLDQFGMTGMPEHVE